MKRMFDGLKVIDCASFIAAPAAATILSDFGADVIKIEPPGVGDAYRLTSASPGLPQTEHNFPWMLDFRNKRSLAVDLASADGKAILHRLVAGADVFITNYPAAVRTKLGFGYDAMAALNKRLYDASFSGYGERGAEAAKPGFDTTAWWARSGMMDSVRAAGAIPARATGGMGDHPSALALFSGIVMALYRRQMTGEGAEVSSSLLANGVWANGFLAQAALCGGEFHERRPREEAFNALGNMYECRDGLWLILAIHNEDRQWPDLLHCVERPDLLSDPRFATKADRLANAPALIAELDAIFATRDRAHWRERLHARGIIFDIVAAATDLRDDPQLRENDIVTSFEGSDMLTVASPINVSGETKVVPRMAPGLGEHTDEILREVGFGDADILRMRNAKAVA